MYRMAESRTPIRRGSTLPTLELEKDELDDEKREDDELNKEELEELNKEELEELNSEELSEEELNKEELEANELENEELDCVTLDELMLLLTDIQPANPKINASATLKRLQLMTNLLI